MLRNVVGQEAVPKVLTLEGASALRLLAHEARQRVIAEVYDSGREITATQAAELCGLTPSAMSYHLRMLERAGVLLPSEATDGRERRYRRAAERFEVRGARVDDPAGRVHLRATAGIWVDSLSRAIDDWVSTGPAAGRTGGLSTESLRLTPEQNEAFMQRLRALLEEYGDVSDANDDQTPSYLMFWAHVPKVRGAGTEN